MKLAGSIRGDFVVNVMFKDCAVQMVLHLPELEAENMPALLKTEDCECT